MNIYDAIQARRTIHKYEPNVPMDAALLKSALNAAISAPNHKFTFPWKFISVGPKKREELAELACLLKEKDSGQELSHDGRLNTKSKILNPSALVLFCRKLVDDDFRAKEDYATISCSIQNFSLVLAAEGWGSKWSSGSLTRAPETYELFGLDRDQYAIEAFMWVGKASVEPSPQRRPGLDELLEVTP